MAWEPRKGPAVTGKCGKWAERAKRPLNRKFQNRPLGRPLESRTAANKIGCSSDCHSERRRFCQKEESGTLIPSVTYIQFLVCRLQQCKRFLRLREPQRSLPRLRLLRGNRGLNLLNRNELCGINPRVARGTVVRLLTIATSFAHACHGKIS